MELKFNNDWDKLLEGEFEKDYFIKLKEFLENEYATKTIYPAKEDIFNALRYTSCGDVKVVILGQDPYHGEGQAHGLAFSVKPGVAPPPSLVNMFKELNSDLGLKIPNNGCLTKWAKQGVLLLNAALTVQEGNANSHQKKGWEKFTDRIIEILNSREKPVIFLLWGNNAKEKLSIIKGYNHYVLSTVHPSPLSASRGFMGCRHFSKVNNILTQIGEMPIDWQIEDI